MSTSTLTNKGQTTVPLEIREALKVKPGQCLTWSLRNNGTVVVSPQTSALDLFGSFRSRKKFRGHAAEWEAVAREAGRHAAKEGVE